MAVFGIAVLGAPRSGKTQLAHALRDRLAALPRAGTTAFFVADDPPLWTLQRLPGFAAILLMGLDLPAASPYSRQDALLRGHLESTQSTYHVVYGSNAQRAAHALAALGLAPPPIPQAAARTAWTCEKCSDPECEQRLFQRLLDDSHRQGV